VKEGTFGRGAPRGNAFARTQLFAADRRTSHGSKKKKLSGSQWKRLRKQKKATVVQQVDGGPELEAPTAANHALGLMPIPGAAVAQKDRCHLEGHLTMPRAR